MCGILGCISEHVDDTRFARALDTLAHRGPFHRGQLRRGALRLGMTRLPMSSSVDYPLPVEVNGWLATYNGEVYESTAGGLPAEVARVIDAIRAGGEFPDGMYAFAMLEPSGARLHLGRDVFGIKPLYYRHDAQRGEFAFASELPALLALLGPQRLDRESVADVVATGAVLQYRTMFEGVQVLPPGTLLSFDVSAPRQAPSLTALRLAGHEAAGAIDAADAIDDLGAALDSSIERCSDTFRDVGLLLSGGIDSTLVNACLPPDTARFHVSVSDSGDHPPPQPGLRVCELGGDDFWPLARRAVRSYAAPTRMSSLLMYQALADLVRQHDSYCVLLGEGADELFWGYPRHLAMDECDFTLTPRRLAGQYFGDFDTKSGWLDPALAQTVLQRVDAVTADLYTGDLDEAIWHFDLHYSLEPLLRRADHLLMSRTVEARLPFLHGRVPAIARGLGRERLAQHQQKAPLQALIRRRVPDYPIEKKRHFRLPFTKWAGLVDEMRDFLRRGLDELHALGLTRLSEPDVQRLDGSDAFTLTTLLLWRQAFSEHLQ
ncbi:asparagine synthetase B family protein [Burkholderia plantarii]|uniref:asparagine synthase (glutamine-hydrolyzing) n=1 Tax=Burkholderia plantarii TaxID=41899 RepID=A0A0B6RXR3_BURPL|nr:asparagine synthetase B [Burkholderia plantarii]AJK48188.1 putative asparagine synthase (glutamine-hydrolyzing) [Burkholderia plantarii]ALK32377.1 asparagine synthase [Burkholderia plantarii]GLZ18919.1 asparagine synthase [Burkholderia plantarii]